MKLRHLAWSLVVSLLVAGTFWAQQGVPSPKTVVVRAGHLLDVKTGKTLANQVIVPNKPSH